MSDQSASSGRPTSFSRDEAIERAMHLFWRDGYLAVTTRDLAAAMNIQRSSFYNSFGSKGAVFEEALQTYSRQAPDAALDNIREGQPVLPAMIAMLRELCRVRAADVGARGCLVCNSIGELVGVDDEIGPMLDAAVSKRIAVLKSLFDQAVRQNEFSPRASTADLARSFLALLLGVNMASKTIRSDADLWAVCTTFLLGIGVQESLLN